MYVAVLNLFGGKSGRTFEKFLISISLNALISSLFVWRAHVEH